MSRQLLHEVRDVLRAADAIASEREFVSVGWAKANVICAH